MNVAEIELELKELVSTPFDVNEFVYHFLEIYQAPATLVKRAG
tara:strand:+ start:64 stop:192 length:129 start_codon:yes stop_codon:yes gene_type:complete